MISSSSLFLGVGINPTVSLGNHQQLSNDCLFHTSKASSPCGTMPLPLQLSQSCNLLEYHLLVGRHPSNLNFLKDTIPQSLILLWDSTSTILVFSKLQSPEALSPCGTTSPQPQLSQSCYPSEPHPLVGQCLYHSSFLKAVISQSFIPLWVDASHNPAFSKLLSPRASSSYGRTSLQPQLR